MLQREVDDDCVTALGWTPEEKRARQRQKTSWRRTAEAEKRMEKLERG